MLSWKVELKVYDCFLQTFCQKLSTSGINKAGDQVSESFLQPFLNILNHKCQVLGNQFLILNAFL